MRACMPCCVRTCSKLPHRSKVRALANGPSSAKGHHPLQGLTGAVDAVDEEEQEEWEEDLLTSAVDGIGWVIKGRKDTFIPVFEAALKPLVLPLLAINGAQQQEQVLKQTPTPSQASFGLCMCIDVLEHCGEPGRRSVFPALLPALLAGCHGLDHVSSTRQASRSTMDTHYHSLYRRLSGMWLTRSTIDVCPRAGRKWKFTFPWDNYIRNLAPNPPPLLPPCVRALTL